MKHDTRLCMFLPILMLFFNTSSAQTFLPVRVRDTSLTRIFNNILSINQFQAKNIGITVLNVTNEAGSAHVPETDEVTANLYLAVTESDTNPKRSLFCIKNLFGVSNIRFEKTEQEAGIILFNYIDISNPNRPVKKEYKVRVSLDAATRLK